MNASPDRLIVIAGPTAVGKSDTALELAERVGGEIVNGDALQLYRGMDIGTAKVPLRERRGVPHHLLDILDITETATVAAYQRDARAEIERILARGRTPVLIGGSGLYLHAVVDELAFPATDPVVRSRLESELADRGSSALHARLAAVDPAAARAIEPRNGRRIVRALEVVELTGRPFSASMPVRGPFRYDAVWFCLDRATVELDARIELRVDRMLELGFLDEVRELDRLGLRRGVTASRALGYSQLLSVLDGGLTLREARDQTVTGTRRYVRRQRSWFRRDDRQIWLGAGQPDLVGTLLATARRSLKP